MALCGICQSWFVFMLESCYIPELDTSLPNLSEHHVSRYWLQKRSKGSQHDRGKTDGHAEAVGKKDGAVSDEEKASIHNQAEVENNDLMGLAHEDIHGLCDEKKSTEDFEHEYEFTRDLDGLRMQSSCWLCCWFSIQQGIAQPRPPARVVDSTENDGNISESYQTARTTKKCSDGDALRISVRLVTTITNTDAASGILMIGITSVYRRLHRLYLQLSRWDGEVLESDSRLRGRKIASMALTTKSGYTIWPPEPGGDTHAYCNQAETFCQCRMSMVRHWLQKCCDSHLHCNQTIQRTLSSASLPTRLILIDKTSNKAKLIETNVFSGNRNIQYATLSHCWGTEKFLTLTCQNYSDFLTEIPTLRISRTFREAMRTCRLLDIRYLWIDCLCIVQDSPNDEDWRREAPNMHQVYGHSFLNISAAASRHADEGLYRPLYHPFMHPFQMRLPGGMVLCNRNIGCSDALSDVYKSSPILGRGWILQECFMAPRVLHFDVAEIIWQCNSSVISEFDEFRVRQVPENRLPNREPIQRYESFLYQTPMRGIKTVSELNNFWERTASDYSQTTVTRPQDRYYALSGLVKLFSQCYEELGAETRYFAGCWEHDLMRYLLWYNDCGRTWNSLSLVSIPSWSWLRGTQISFDRPPDGSLDMKLLRVDARYLDDHFPFGPTEYVHIHIEAKILGFETSEGDQSMPEQVRLNGGKEVEEHKICNGHPLYCRFYFDDESIENGHAGLCAVYSIEKSELGFFVRALIVKPAEPKLDGNNYYQRYGALEITCHAVEKSDSQGKEVEARDDDDDDDNEYEYSKEQRSELSCFFTELNLVRQRICLV